MSYTNSWQYNVMVKAPVTYYNKKFEEKEELREQHIQWELDREKTYYRSALEKINPQEIKNQMENEKVRRTNMLLALNKCVMDKTSTTDGFSFNKNSGSLKKLQQVPFIQKKTTVKEAEVRFLDT